MENYNLLDAALDRLNKNIKKFPVGAKTLDDYKPLEEKVEDVKRELKNLFARILILKARIDMNSSDNVEEKFDLKKELSKFNENTTNLLINQKTMHSCVDNTFAQHYFSNESTNKEEFKERLKQLHSKLYSGNDKMITLTKIRKELAEKQIKLRLECHSIIYDYSNYLVQQQVNRNKQLEETNPNLLKNKKKIESLIYKINTMKKLITNLIALNGFRLNENKLLLKLMAKHKKLISFQTFTD